MKDIEVLEAQERALLAQQEAATYRAAIARIDRELLDPQDLREWLWMHQVVVWAGVPCAMFLLGIIILWGVLR